MVTMQGKKTIKKEIKGGFLSTSTELTSVDMMYYANPFFFLQIILLMLAIYLLQNVRNQHNLQFVIYKYHHFVQPLILIPRMLISRNCFVYINIFLSSQKGTNITMLMESLLFYDITDLRATSNTRIVKMFD